MIRQFSGLRRQFFGLSAVSLLVAGCASRGTDFDPKQVENLKPGITTLAEATRLLGAPNSVTIRADRSKLVQWIYLTATMGSMTKKHVVVLFDTNDVLVRVDSQTQGRT